MDTKIRYVGKLLRSIKIETTARLYSLGLANPAGQTNVILYLEAGARCLFYVLRSYSLTPISCALSRRSQDPISSRTLTQSRAITHGESLYLTRLRKACIVVGWERKQQ